MQIDSKNTRAKTLEEIYLGLQLMTILFSIIILKYFRNSSSLVKQRILTYFFIIYILYVLVQFIIFIRKVYFKNSINKIYPNIFLACIDGMFLIVFFSLFPNYYQVLFHLFYIYIILQTMRFHNKNSSIFSTYISILYIILVIKQNPKLLISFEVFINIFFFYLISYILSSILKEFNHIESQLEYMYKEIANKNILLQSIASKDYLTNMYNHRSFYDILDNTMKSSEKDNLPFCLALLDIDDFKLVNDTLGHLAGDMVLKELSSIIQNKTRNQDIAARYGGEEFAIIFPNTCLKEAKKICEKIRQLIENHTFSIEDKKVKITISGGIGEVIVSETLVKEQALVKYVDKLLYEAKNNGKNQIKYNSNTICMM